MKKRTVLSMVQSPLYLLLFSGYLLLPVLFQTWLGFSSRWRGVWEGVYLLLAVLLAFGVWQAARKLGPGVGALIPALASGTGALWCRNLWLGIALMALTAALILVSGGHWAVKAMLITGIILLGVLLCLRLLAFSLIGQVTYTVPVPNGRPGEYAEVRINDPGAMGRIRYFATEQHAVFDGGDLLRVSVVTGRDSAASGNGTYGWLIDDYLCGGNE